MTSPLADQTPVRLALATIGLCLGGAGLFSWLGFTELTGFGSRLLAVILFLCALPLALLGTILLVFFVLDMFRYAARSHQGE